MNKDVQAGAPLTASGRATEKTADTRFWLMREDPYAADYRRGAIWVDSENRIVNSKEFQHALFELKQTRSVKITGDVRLPEGFLRPMLSLPPVDFAPDYFTMESEVFVSRRFREALAQPDDVVQYWPVDIVRASDEAREQDYKFFRVLAWQEAMDWERSVYTKSDSFNRRTGEKFVSIEDVKRFVPRADLAPRSEVFRSAESSIFVLVTDGLAERVLRAGCEGVAFRDPETLQLTRDQPVRFRTVDGIGTIDP